MKDKQNIHHCRDVLNKMLRHALATLLRLHESNPRQRTPEWYDMRRLYVGASEIGPLLGDLRNVQEDDSTNRGDTMEIMKLVEKKMERLVVTDPPPVILTLAWGAFVENVCARIFEQMYSCKVVGRDLTIVTKYGFMCSPDGYCVARVNEETGLPDSSAEPKIYVIEFKSPITRSIVYDKRFPLAAYEAQIQCALALSSDIVDRGLFVEMQFLVCSLDTLYLEGRYNKSIHSGLCILDTRGDVQHIIVMLNCLDGRVGDLGAEASREKFAAALDTATIVDIIVLPKQQDCSAVTEEQMSTHAILPLKLVGVHSIVARPIPGLEDHIQRVMKRVMNATHIAASTNP